MTRRESSLRAALIEATTKLEAEARARAVVERRPMALKTLATIDRLKLIAGVR